MQIHNKRYSFKLVNSAVLFFLHEISSDKVRQHPITPNLVMIKNLLTLEVDNKLNSTIIVKVELNSNQETEIQRV